MLPGSTPERVDREAAKGKQSGRTQEIQRLIGRSLRAVTDLVDARRGADHRRLRRAAGRRRHAHGVDLRRLPRAARRVLAAGRRRRSCRRTRSRTCARRSRSASCQALPSLDLDYSEDSTAEVDMNVVMTGAGQVHRGAGHGRRRRVQPRRARRRCSGLAEHGHRRDLRPAARDARGAARRRDGGDAAALVVATGNPDKAREIRRRRSTRAATSSSIPRPTTCPTSRRPA